MNQSERRTPWEYSKALLSLAAVASNAPQNHAVIDRLGYASMIMDGTMSVSGGATGGTLTLQLQDSDDGVTFANYDSPVAVAITAGNAAGAIASLPVRLNGARRYVRAVSTGAPTGGASPVVTLGATLRLYGPDKLPAV